MLNFIYIPLRLILIASAIFCFLIVGSFILLFCFPFKFLRRRLATEINVICSRVVLSLLHFKVTHVGPLPKEGSLIIGNHLSYLDILIYLSRFKTLFVTSVDMKWRFLLGQITVLGGCLYVERRNPRNLPKELKTLKKFFDNGFTVCVFPEGTSSDGLSVLPFKKSLFQIALETKAPIQPIVLRYTKINGQPFSDKNNDLVCWYGDLNFFKHFCKLLTLKSIEAELRVLPTIDSTKFSDRKSLADHTHRIVLNQYLNN